MTDVAIGFIGLGNIAQFHADAARDYGATIAGGTDLDADAREAFAQKYDAPVYEDQAEMVEDCDAVLVSTPNRYHEECVVGALEAGCDVLVEKPLAHTLESAERIAETAREADGFCMVGFHNRFRAPVEVLDAYREQGDLGTVGHVEAEYVRRRGVPGRGSWFTRKDVAGGGAVIDVGVHALDVALYLLDFPDIAEVSAETRTQFGTDAEYAYLDMWGEDQGAGGVDVEDSASAFVRTEDGRTISLEVAWASNRPPSQEIRFRGDRAGATLDMNDDSLTVHETATAGATHHRDTDVETAGDDPHAAEHAYFLDHVERGERPEMNTVEEGLTVQRVIDAIYESGETGRAVQL